MADGSLYKTPDPQATTNPHHQEALLAAAKGSVFGVLALLDLAGENELVKQASELHIAIIRRWRERM